MVVNLSEYYRAALADPILRQLSNPQALINLIAYYEQGYKGGVLDIKDGDDEVGLFQIRPGVAYDAGILQLSAAEALAVKKWERDHKWTAEYKAVAQGAKHKANRAPGKQVKYLSWLVSKISSREGIPVNRLTPEQIYIFHNQGLYSPIAKRVLRGEKVSLKGQSKEVQRAYS